MYWIEQAKKEYQFLLKCHELMSTDEAGMEAFLKALRDRVKALEENAPKHKRGDQLHAYAEIVAARFVLEEIEDNGEAADPEAQLLRAEIVEERTYVPF